MQLQCELRDSLIHDQLSSDDYELYKKKAKEIKLEVPEANSDFSTYDINSEIYFFSVFDNKMAFDNYIYMCQKLKLSSQYYAVYVNLEKGRIESFYLKYGTDFGDKYAPLA